MQTKHFFCFYFVGLNSKKCNFTISHLCPVLSNQHSRLQRYPHIYHTEDNKMWFCVDDLFSDPFWLTNIAKIHPNIRSRWLSENVSCTGQNQTHTLKKKNVWKMFFFVNNFSSLVWTNLPLSRPRWIVIWKLWGEVIMSHTFTKMKATFPEACLRGVMVR